MPKRPEFCIEQNLTHEECSNVPLTELVTIVGWPHFIILIAFLLIGSYYICRYINSLEDNDLKDEPGAK